MEDFDVVNDRVKDSINAFLKDSSDNPANTLSDFGLKFFKSICNDCVRRDCTVRHTLLNANMISGCKYFTAPTIESLRSRDTQYQPGSSANQYESTGAITGLSSIAITTAPIGGTIFYIDDTADGVYAFFDACGNRIENVQVGDRPYACRVMKKGSKDKYYVYHDEVYENLRWTYCKEDNYSYKSLGTSGDRGSGKRNTEIVMAEDYGAYIAKDSKGYPTIWYQLQQIRNAEVGGCNDWFVPSAYEVNELRSIIKSGKITGGKIAGSSYDKSVFSKKWLWSSSDYSAKYSWYWGFSSQSWCYSYKHYHNSVFFTRAF